MNKENYPSKDLMYEWGRTAPEQLSKVADALDTKILGVFSIACIIVSVIPALTNKIQCSVSLTPFIIALISFIAILIKSLMVLHPQSFYVADSPKILREDFWELEPEEAKKKYWEHLEKDFGENYHKLQIKGRALRWTVWLLAIETISMIVWLFL
jgi:hypothetical protein